MSLKVLLLEGVHPIASQLLVQQGFQVESENRSLKGAELTEALVSFDAVGIRSKTQLTESVLRAAPQLKAVGAFCIGTNQVDLGVSNLLGVPVFNAPYSNTRSVAELVIGEMIMLSRQLGDRNRLAHQGVWKKSASGAHEVRGKTLGIVGYGHIGSQLSVMAEMLGLRVQYFDVIKKLPLGNARALETLEELLATSDFVSLHVPATDQTRGMIGESELHGMKPQSYLINASRGSVVDIVALSKALKSGALAGAAVDVFPQEPSSNKDPFHSELQGLDNVVLTPHIGGSTEEAQEAIGKEVAESLIRYLSHGKSLGAVQFPQLDPPWREGACRIMNVHENVPGVLGEINKIVSQFGGNIEGQYLSTDQNIGYLVMDLKAGRPEQLALEISELGTSLKTRWLIGE